MSFEFWGFNQPAFLSPPAGSFGYLLVLVYAVIGLVALVRGLPALARLKAGQWLGLLSLFAAGRLLWPLLILSYYAYSPTTGLPGWDYVWPPTSAAFPVFLAEAALAGLLAEFARAGLPAWWFRPRKLRPPPYLSSLNRKLVFGLVPVGALGIALLFWANIHIATSVATNLMVDQMAGAAETAGRGIPFFIQTGQNLVASIA